MLPGKSPGTCAKRRSPKRIRSATSRPSVNTTRLRNESMDCCDSSSFNMGPLHAVRRDLFAQRHREESETGRRANEEEWGCETNNKTQLESAANDCSCNDLHTGL